MLKKSSYFGKQVNGGAPHGEHCCRCHEPRDSGSLPMADRFYCEDALDLGDYVLEGPEAHHMQTVRRFKTGDRVTLFNGDGYDYFAEILTIAKKSIGLCILEKRPADRELTHRVIIASALPKGDRTDFLIEKLTELGVSRFIPLFTERSVVQPKEAKVEKWHRQVIEASKQCGRNQLMTIESPQSWPLVVKRTDLPTSKLIMHTSIQGAPSVALISLPTDRVIAIGPEGGWTDNEVAVAQQHDWEVLWLGSRVLRIETAAITAAVWAGIGRQ